MYKYLIQTLAKCEKRVHAKMNQKSTKTKEDPFYWVVFTGYFRYAITS